MIQRGNAASFLYRIKQTWFVSGLLINIILFYTVNACHKCSVYMKKISLNNYLTDIYHDNMTIYRNEALKFSSLFYRFVGFFFLKNIVA